jgi:hypothetical protein
MMGLLSVLTLIFVVCKILSIGVIANWSWWMVFTPVWIGLGLAVLLFCFAILCAFLTTK